MTGESGKAATPIPTQHAPGADCSTPKKHRYATLEAAQQAIARVEMTTGTKLHSYDTCACGWIHLTKEEPVDADPYTEHELLRMDQAEFEQVVRTEIHGRAHKDTVAALRTDHLLNRWFESLGLFSFELSEQLAARKDDGSQVSKDWRRRVGVVQSIIGVRRNEIRHLRRLKHVPAPAYKNHEDSRTEQVAAGKFTARELRTIAGERAVDRLKFTHLDEFLVFLAEEYETLGVQPGEGLGKKMAQARARLLTTDTATGEERPVPDRPVYRATATPAPMSDGTTWWAIEVQGLPEGNIPVTQGRDREDAHVMTRDLIALLLDVDEDSFDIDITFIEDTKEQS